MGIAFGIILTHTVAWLLLFWHFAMILLILNTLIALSMISFLMSKLALTKFGH